MPIEITIPDAALTGFNAQAQTKLHSVVKEFVDDLIDESNRIEAGQNTTEGAPEITSSMVSDARVFVRSGSTPRKESFGRRLVRILAPVLTLVVGVMYDKQSLQQGVYMAVFVIFIAAAILCTTLSALQD